MEPSAALVVATLVAQASNEPTLLLGMREHDAALAGRELLVRIEAEDTGRAVRADRAALVLGSERLRRVLDQHQCMPLADRPQLVELAGIAEHIDRHESFRPRRDGRLDRRRIELQR